LIAVGVAAKILPVPVTLHWFLPTYGDSRLIVGGGHGTPAGVAHSDRDASIDYLASIVRAAEVAGRTLGRAVRATMTAAEAVTRRARKKPVRGGKKPRVTRAKRDR